MANIGKERHEDNRKMEEHVCPALGRLLPAKLVGKWARQAKFIFRGGLYSAALTLRKCIQKQLEPKSARAIESTLARTAKVVGCSGSKGQPELTPDGKDFCGARARLPLAVFSKALAYLAAESPGSAQDRYQGLTLAMVDGTTAATTRTKENLDYFKASRNQKGLSRFPIVRITLLLCAGVIAAIAADPYHTSEVAQAVQLFLNLPRNHLLLADALYGSFLNLVLITRCGSHLICARHVNRKGQRLKRLGYRQWLERFSRPLPAHCHCPELLLGMPGFFAVRKIERIVHRKGFRDYTLVLYTTLLDPRQYPAEDIVKLYLRRWSIELDLRALKTQHGLSNLTCKSPETVLREIYSCCLAFNCVRASMAQTGNPVHRLSHKTATEILCSTDTEMTYVSARLRAALVRCMLEQIGAAILPIQIRGPEPRSIVHNLRRFPYLKCTRKQWRAWHRVAA